MNKSACIGIVFLLTTASFTQAGLFDSIDKGLSDTEKALQSGQQTVDAAKQGTQAVQAVQANPTGALVDTLVKQLRVTPVQAQGGAGALFQAARAQMTDEAFNSVAQAVPEMENLLSAVNSGSSSKGLTPGLTALAGEHAGKINTAASLVSSFQELGLSSDMVGQFVPILVDYVKQNGGETTASLLSAALTGFY